jgi:uncharacterized iron-regulated protein
MFEHRLLRMIPLIAAATLTLAAEDAARLPVGDPARREKVLTVQTDTITDATTGKPLTPAELAAKLDEVRVVFVGESHTDTSYHQVQFQVIRELQKRGRTVLVGLEMFPYTAQPALDRWNAGQESEQAFLDDSHWYLNWGYNWAYYREIFLFARERGIRFYGVNTPREVVAAVRKKGFKDLTPEEAAAIPARIDTSSAEHRRVVKALFSDDDSLMHTMSDQVFEGMFSAQCTWDATMGFNAVQALRKSGGPKDIMVVLIGQGHVVYGLGIQRQAASWFEGKMASVIPVHVEDLKGKDTAKVQASFADYLWGLGREEEPLFPAVGMSTRGGRNGLPMSVIDVQKDSPALAAGLKVGDVLVSMDGKPVKDLETYQTIMSTKRWADPVAFVVTRDKETVALTVQLRRSAPHAKESAPAPKAP